MLNDIMSLSWFVGLGSMVHKPSYIYLLLILVGALIRGMGANARIYGILSIPMFM